MINSEDEKRIKTIVQIEIMKAVMVAIIVIEFLAVYILALLKLKG